MGGLLLGAGISFVKDLITNYGEEVAVSGIEKITGVKLKGKTKLTSAEISQINLYKTKILEFDYKKLELEIRDKELQYANTDSARNMQNTALEQEDKFSKQFIYWFAIVWSVFAITYITAITFLEIPPDNIRFADTIIGFLLGTIISAIINFFYGSSVGSKQKTELLTKALPNEGK